MYLSSFHGVICSFARGSSKVHPIMGQWFRRTPDNEGYHHLPESPTESEALWLHRRFLKVWKWCWALIYPLLQTREISHKKLIVKVENPWDVLALWQSNSCFWCYLLTPNSLVNGFLKMYLGTNQRPEPKLVIIHEWVSASSMKQGKELSLISCLGSLYNDCVSRPSFMELKPCPGVSIPLFLNHAHCWGVWLFCRGNCIIISVTQQKKLHCL